LGCYALSSRLACPRKPFTTGKSSQTGDAEERPAAAVIKDGRFTITNLYVRFARNSILYHKQGSMTWVQSFKRRARKRGSGGTARRYKLDLAVLPE